MWIGALASLYFARVEYLHFEHWPVVILWIGSAVGNVFGYLLLRVFLGTCDAVLTVADGE